MNRDDALAQLSEPFDVLVVGGGATGLGTAVDAAARGYRVALLEAQDFAQGTSSRSTKLVHGGVRYLAQGNVGLVREALRERGRLRQNAPHLVGDLEFVVPAYAWWSGPYYGVGLKLYDVLAGRYRLKKSQLISRAQVLERIPTLQPTDLRGGVVYFDGQFDDARLALALARTAHAQGAVLVNHARVVALRKQNGKLDGVVVRDLESNRELSVRARCVVNATGVFADKLRQLDDPQAQPCLSPSQGVHLVLPGSFLNGNSALMVPRTDDGRVLQGVLYTPAGTDAKDKPLVTLVSGRTGDTIQSSSHWMGWRIAQQGYAVFAPGMRISGVAGVQEQTLASAAADLGHWNDKLASMGYKRIVMGGHSNGGIWLSNYLSLTHDKRVVGTIYIALGVRLAFEER